MSTTSTVRYVEPAAVLEALDLDPATVGNRLTARAKTRAEAATQKWVNRTGRPFHPVRIGDPDDPRTWEVHDVQDAISWYPATVIVDNAGPLPIDATQGDAIEVRSGRDTWEDVTGQEGDAWVFDYRRRRLRIYERRFANTPWDDPNTRFVRLTYRHGPLGMDVTVTNDGLVEGVPADVTEAVAAKAATMLALNDEQKTSAPDSGQLTNRSTKRQALEETWESTTAAYSGFSTV